MELLACRELPEKTVSDASAYYIETYLQTFLPELQKVNHSVDRLTISERYSAIKFAADSSLAFTARGATWSRALSQQLSMLSGEQGSSGSIQQDGHVFRRCGDSADPFPSSISVPSEVTSCPALPKNRCGNKKLSLSAVSTGLRKNWRKDYASPGDVNRLAIVKKITRNCCYRRRLLRVSTGGSRIVHRKVTSLFKLGRRLARSRRTAPNCEQDQIFESRITALQRLVPGGDSMDATVLLDETVDFVMFLKCQVQALQTVANAVERQGRFLS